MNGLARLGCIRTGVEVNAILRMSKATWAFGFHEEALNILDRGWSSPTLDGLDL